MIMKKTTALLSIIGIVSFLMFSCQKESDSSNAELIIKTSAAPLLKSAVASASTIVIDTFYINIKDIEFEFEEGYAGSYGTDDDIDDDDCSDNDKDDSYDDLEAEGPYLIDIMSPEALNGLVLDSYSIPNAVYDEIEFELACYHLTDNNKMQGRSAYLAGTINGNRFKLWTDKVKEFEIEFPDQSAVSLTGDNMKLYIDISLEKIKSNLEATNLGAAVDGNNNGYIEIGHDDTDGNHSLSGSLLNAISGCFDLDDNCDDDCGNDCGDNCGDDCGDDNSDDSCDDDGDDD